MSFVYNITASITLLNSFYKISTLYGTGIIQDQISVNGYTCIGNSPQRINSAVLTCNSARALQFLLSTNNNHPQSGSTTGRYYLCYRTQAGTYLWTSLGTVLPVFTRTQTCDGTVDNQYFINNNQIYLCYVGQVLLQVPPVYTTCIYQAEQIVTWSKQDDVQVSMKCAVSNLCDFNISYKGYIIHAVYAMYNAINISVQKYIMNLVDRLILVQQYIDDIKQHIRVVIDPDLIDLNIALFDRGDPRVQDVSYVQKVLGWLKGKFKQ